MAINKRFIAKNGLDNNNQTITNVADPVNSQDVATKNFASNASNLTTGTISDSIIPTSVIKENGSGKVGIGTIDPRAKFDLNGSSASNIVSVTASDIDCSLGNYFTKSINGAITFTFSNIPASRAFSFVLAINHTAGSITWPATVYWSNGTAPTLTIGKTHLFVFVTSDGGATWRGNSSINY